MLTFPREPSPQPLGSLRYDLFRLGRYGSFYQITQALDIILKNVALLGENLQAPRF